MPSVDTIRNIKIQGSSNGVDEATAALNKLTASIAAANDNLSKTKTAANENAEGFRITGEGALVAANHMRQAAEAAYVFSPAFRGVVNEMAAPALKAAHVALEAVAAGLVAATNVAGSGLIALAGAAERASPALLAYTGGVRTAGLAMEAFAPSVGGVAASILSKMLPALSLLGKWFLVVDAIRLVGFAWQSAGEQIEKYVQISKDATSAGVGAEFFQRIGKSAEDAGLKIDDATAAMKKFNDASTPKLGGSDIQNRIDELTKAGNFSGNSGVAAFASAASNEDRFRAIVSLVDQAMQKGERLAALDLTSKFLPPSLQDSLSKDSEHLKNMLASADEISGKKLASQADVDIAASLTQRYDAATKILSERFIPFLDTINTVGTAIRMTWVSFVETLADVATAFSKVGEQMDKIQKAEDERLAKQGIYPGGGTAPQFGPDYISPQDFAKQQRDAADQKLRTGLANSNNVAAARDQTNEIYGKVFRDVSKPIGTKTDAPDTSAYDRATESVLKYIEVTKAASLSVSDAAAEQEKFKVVAQLTAAGIKDGLTPEAAKLKAEMSGLGEKAGAAADALAKARVASSIDFDRKSAFLSQEDVSIAQQLKGIYGNDVPAALNSTYAAGIRVNNAFKQISSAIEGSLTTGLADIVDGTKSVGQGFADMGKLVIRAIEEMIIKITIIQPLMRGLQGAMGGLGSFSFGGGGSTGAAASSTGAAGVGGLGGLYHTGGMVGSEPTSMRYIHPAYFDNAPKFHTGGIAGDEVPIIAKRGEGVFTPGQMAALGGGGSSSVNVTVVNQTGVQADTETSKGPNGDITITLKKMVDGIVADSMSQGSGARVLKNQYGIKPFTGR